MTTRTYGTFLRTMRLSALIDELNSQTPRVVVAVQTPGGNATTDTAAFQAAAATVVAAGSGTIVVRASTTGANYLVDSVAIRPGMTWEFEPGAVAQAPVTAGSQSSIFTTDGVEHVGATDSTLPIVFNGAVLDGNRANRGAYSAYEQEHSNLIEVKGDVSQPGRVRVEIRNCHFMESVGDGLSVGPNVDLTLENVSSVNCFRGSPTIYGGNSRVRGVNLSGTGTVERYGLHIEIDTVGYGGSLAADIVIDGAQYGDNPVTVGFVPDAAHVQSVRLSHLTCGPGSIFSSAGGAQLRISDSLLRMGIASSTTSRFVNPTDVVLTNCDLEVTEAVQSVEANNTLYAAHVFWNVGDATPKHLTFRGCRFRVASDVENADTVIAVFSEANTFTEGHRLDVIDCEIAAGFGEGIHIDNGGTVEIRHVRNLAAVPLSLNGGTGLEFDVTVDDMSVGGSATKFAHVVSAATGCTLRHRNILIDSALAGITTGFGLTNLTTRGERVILAAAAPGGSQPGVAGDRWRLKVPVSATAYEYVCTATSPTAATWKAAVTLA